MNARSLLGRSTNPSRGPPVVDYQTFYPSVPIYPASLQPQSRHPWPQGHLKRDAVDWLDVTGDRGVKSLVTNDR